MEKLLLEIVFIIAGIAIVLWGANTFTDGASGLARRLKVSELVIGLTVVALGTSLPEFMVSFLSVLRASSDMSVGNIIGSNVFNILVIIGGSALMSPLAVNRSMLVRDFPICVLTTAMLVLFAYTKSTVSTWEGLVMVAFFCGYLYMAYRIAMADRKEAKDVVLEEKTPMPKLILLILLGMAALVFGGRVLVDNAASVARDFGISESVIGMTILAAGTSLPEFATSVVAAKKGSLGLAFGNVIGSNVFNIAFVIGTCSSIVPMTVTEITLKDWLVFFGSVVLVWLVAATGRRINRLEGALLVICYLTYLLSLIIG
ncbi:MAG: calcium/sodium antiporter [Bacteroidaceae bacterium]|nr:calcium/sodium antiporter [Bacteroidaceae bacterium]